MYKRQREDSKLGGKWTLTLAESRRSRRRSPCRAVRGTEHFPWPRVLANCSALKWGKKNPTLEKQQRQFLSACTVKEENKVNSEESKPLSCPGCCGSVAQWIECQLANQRVAGLIPSQGTCLGCGPGPQEGTCERQPHIDVPLLLFLPPFPL